MPKEQYMCQLCANHGIFNQPKKGHKQKCPHRLCPCPLCALNTKRRRLDQMERQLRTVETETEDDGDGGNNNRNNNSLNNFATVSVSMGNGMSNIPVTLFQPFNFQVKHEHNEIIRSMPMNTVECRKMKMERKNVGKESHRHLSSFSSSSPPYCVPIPATLAHHQLRNLKRPAAPISPELQAERKRRAELFEQTLARITAKKSSSTSSTTPSIFHSVQMLAEPG